MSNASQRVKIGKRYGRWRVLSFARQDHKKYWYFHCQCRCGTQRIVRGDNLGKRSCSCGCGTADAIRKARQPASLVGKSFRGWKVKKLIARGGWNKGCPVSALWLCQCSCGATKKARSDMLKSLRVGRCVNCLQQPQPERA